MVVAEVNAPNKVDEEAPREVGSNRSQRSIGAHTTANQSPIGKKDESETSVVKRIAEEESGYAVKSVPNETDPS